MNFLSKKAAKKHCWKRALSFLRVSGLPAHFRFFPHFQNERVHPLTISNAFLKLFGYGNRVVEKFCKEEIAHFKIKIGEFSFLRVSEKMEIFSSKLMPFC